MCKFFVVPGNGQALLGMPDMDTFSIIKINCYTIGTHRNDSADNCSTKTTTLQSSKHTQHYTSMMQDVDRAEKSCTNMNAISKFANKYKPRFIDKEPNTISYFLPGPDQDNDKRDSVEITQQIQRESKHVSQGCDLSDNKVYC